LWATNGTPSTTRQVDNSYFYVPLGFNFQNSSAVAVGNRLYYVPVPSAIGEAGELRDLSFAPLNAPSSVTVQTSPANFQQGLSDVTVSWSNDPPDASGVVIQRSTHEDFSTIDASFYAPAPSTRFVDTAPSGAAVYYYRVLAANAAGDSQPSAPAAAIFSAISGIVFSDDNNDGRREAAELGTPGVTVYVDLNGNGRLDFSDIQATTDASGSYFLGGLPEGNYVVREVVPAGYARTTPSTNSAAVQTSAGQAVAGATFGNVAISSVPMNFDYLLVLAQHYGQPGTFATGDVNGDDVVDFADLLAVAQSYGHPLATIAARDSSAVLRIPLKQRAVRKL